MAVNKPKGDNARKGRSEETDAVEEPTHKDFHQAQ